MIKIDNFGFMNTPILKQKEKSFHFTMKEIFDWKKANDDGKGWKIKYFKGLGTSSAKEFKEYFKKKITFKYNGESGDSIDKVFNKHRADDRKKFGNI